MTTTITQSLFEPYALPTLTLPNRIAMAPMTRYRADDRGIPTGDMAVYYAQRSTAGLIITEGIWPSIVGQTFRTIPGLVSDEQVAGWEMVTAAVHGAGGRIFAQIMHGGRNGHPLNNLDGRPPLAPSAVATTELLHVPFGKTKPVTPVAMTLADIRTTIEDYVAAARNAVRAGFDGVELHGANSYLPHQFLADNTNLRTDAYASRTRFVVELVEAVAAAIGAPRLGLRISPGNPENSMVEADPAPVYRSLVDALDPIGLAYLHVTDNPAYPALADLRPRWSGALIGNTGEHRPSTGEDALSLLTSGVDVVSFGRPFISNPDLPHRLAVGAELAEIDAPRLYSPGWRGYIDYPALHAR
jgi:N-ethylmaleimide reductase